MRIAYLSLQSVVEGQDSWAAVTEIVAGWERAGWDVETWFPSYPASGAPGGLLRVREMARLQLELAKSLARYDALYVRAHPMAYPVARRAHYLGVPVVQECNGTYEDLFLAWPSTRYARPIFEQMQRTQYRDAVLTVCGTTAQREWLRAEGGHDRIVVSPNGANADLFSPLAPRRPGLPERFALFFGQFAPWQGIDVLLAARARGEWPEGVELVFVGDGACRPAVELAAANGRATYLGRLPYAELPGVVAHASVSVTPQYTTERGRTGFSALKLYESMACGVPVVGSDYEGVADVIRRYDCGIVVTPGDPAALAGAVAYLTAHSGIADAMGQRGRMAVESECSWSARAGQRMSAISSALGASDTAHEGTS